MPINLVNFTHFILTYSYVFARISSLFVSAPLFSSKILPLKVKTSLALLLSLIMSSTLNETGLPTPFSIPGILLIIQQILIGFSIGLIFQLILQISVLGGQIIAVQSGFDFALFVDPINHESLPIISELYITLTLLLFLITNSHLYLLSILYKSFTLLPLTSIFSHHVNLMDVVVYCGDIFASALAFAIPAIIALLIVHMTLAMMAKTSPQINLFTFGFPVMIFIGLGMMYLNLPALVIQTEHQFAAGYEKILTFFKDSYE